MKRIIVVLNLVCFVCIAQTGLAQKPTDNFEQSFKSYREHALQEKLYLHLDQTFLLTGEILWFKIYAVDASLHRPMDISKVAYVEVMDKDHKPVLQTKVSLRENGGGGSLFIPATLSSGNYYVRAHTQWMKNFDPAFYFHKAISIVNPFVKAESGAEEDAPTIKNTLDLFPEGGNLVAGLRSRIAFKMTGTEQKAISGKVIITDSNSDTVAMAVPLKFGLGSFYFTPMVDVTYRAVLVDESGHTSVHPFPTVQENGYVMEVSDSTDTMLKVLVRFSDENLRLRAVAGLLVHARNFLVHAEVKPVNPEDAVFVISKDKLPDGISHLTIFDTNNNPVCERLYFKMPEQKLSATVQTDQKQYGIRRKVSLKINTASVDEPAQANLSISVYKLDSLSLPPTDGIFEYLFLSSDLKGEVESPAYYFNSSDSLVKKCADNLMLTHGWRRFTWKDVFGKAPAYSFIPEYRGHLVKAKVLSSNGSPVAGVLTYMSSPGKMVSLYGARSNPQGEIFYETSNLSGARKLVIQTNTQRDSTLTITVDNPFSTAHATVQVPMLHLSERRADALLTRSMGMQIQDIYNRESLEQVVKSNTDSLPFYGKPNQRYFLDTYTRFPVMEEVMREYVPGVLVRKKRDGFHFLVVNQEEGGILPDDPLVLLDGVPVFDVDRIMAFSPLKVKRLDVVMNTFYVGPIIAPGIVSYSTYQGDLGGFQLDPRALVVDYEGLQRQLEFYSPQYEKQAERNARIPDHRNLLFWSPNVTTNDQGIYELEFYTSDLSGQYQVVVEGLTTNGLAGSGQCTFSVKEMNLN
ncbi:MAG TPA: hypothetical protein VD884_18810 [Ohtaekwangia sp.]|nr:hypothetical protein [Ohtaekwangia sp.]